MEPRYSRPLALAAKGLFLFLKLVIDLSRFFLREENKDEVEPRSKRPLVEIPEDFFCFSLRISIIIEMVGVAKVNLFFAKLENYYHW